MIFPYGETPRPNFWINSLTNEFQRSLSIGLLAILAFSLNACSTAFAETDVQCNHEDCRKVATEAQIDTSNQKQAPAYFLGPHITFSLNETPLSVKHSPSSLIIELKDGQTLVGMVMTQDELTLSGKSEISVHDMFEWYFLRSFSEAKEADLPDSTLDNIAEFKRAFNLGDAQNFAFFRKGSLLVVSFYSSMDSIQRLYIASKGSPNLAYAIDLFGFKPEAVQKLLTQIHNN